MKRYGIAAIAALLVGAFLFPTSALAGVKRYVCHSEGNGGYHLINVSENAFPKHIDHGDAAPGSAVPGMPGYAFDESCVPAPFGPTFCYDNEMAEYPDLEYSGVQGVAGNIVDYFSDDGSCSGSEGPFALALVIADSLVEADAMCDGLVMGRTVLMGDTAANLGWEDFPPDAYLCDLAS